MSKITYTNMFVIMFQTIFACHVAVLECLYCAMLDVSCVFRYEIGEGLYIGWSSAIMALCGGSCLLFSCGLCSREEKK